MREVKTAYMPLPAVTMLFLGACSTQGNTNNHVKQNDVKQLEELKKLNQRYDTLQQQGTTIVDGLAKDLRPTSEEKGGQGPFFPISSDISRLISHYCTPAIDEGLAEQYGCKSEKKLIKKALANGYNSLALTWSEQLRPAGKAKETIGDYAVECMHDMLAYSEYGGHWIRTCEWLRQLPLEIAQPTIVGKGERLMEDLVEAYITNLLYATRVQGPFAQITVHRRVADLRARVKNILSLLCKEGFCTIPVLQVVLAEKTAPAFILDALRESGGPTFYKKLYEAKVSLNNQSRDATVMQALVRMAAAYFRYIPDGRKQEKDWLERYYDAPKEARGPQWGILSEDSEKNTALDTVIELYGQSDKLFTQETLVYLYNNARQENAAHHAIKRFEAAFTDKRWLQDAKKGDKNRTSSKNDNKNKKSKWFFG